MLDQSASECDKALALDPGNFGFRSCGFTFAEMGNIERGMDYLRLDAGSDWVNRNAVRLFWSEGKLSEAREAASKQPLRDAVSKINRACAEHPPSGRSPSAEVSQAAREAEPVMAGNPDPENKYLFATTMAYCGEKEVALRLLKSSIEGRYCAYVALQKDPLLVSLRGTPEFAQLLSAAKQCQDSFLAERAQLSH